MGHIGHGIYEILKPIFGPENALMIVVGLGILVAIVALVLWIVGSIGELFERRRGGNAWVAADQGWYWWWPFKPYWWPRAFPQNETVAAFVKLYGVIGYSPCVDGSLEPGYEKIALYTIGPAVKHVARQLPDGKWASKLGKDNDIEHTLDGLADRGTPVQFLRRARAGTTSLSGTDETGRSGAGVLDQSASPEGCTEWDPFDGWGG
jgi:hypothetical protein